MTSARRRLTPIAGALILTILAAPKAHAQDASLSLTYRAIFHAYQVRLLTDRDANGAQIDRFRNADPLYMTLDVGGYSLGPSSSIDAIASVRFKSDFGSGFNRDTPNDVTEPPKIDGSTQFDILQLYADWRDVTPGLDLRFGRQYIADDLDWYALDGIKGAMRWVNTSSTSLIVEVYAGMPVRIDFLFSSDALLSDGYEVSDGPGLAFGGSARAKLFGDLHLHLAYRQELLFRGDDLEVFRPAPTTPAQQAEYDAIRAASAGSMALQESLLGFGAGYTIRDADLDLYAQATLNLVFGALDMMRVGASYNPRSDLHIGLEYFRVYPRFAADSIFNIFNIFPYDRARAEVDLEIIPGLTAEVGYFALLVHGGPKGPLFPAQANQGSTYLGEDIAHGPSAGVTYQIADYAFGFTTEISTNNGGAYAWGGNYRRFELFGDAGFVENRFGATLRLGALTIQNDWFEGADQGQVDDPESMYSLDIGGRAEIVEWLLVRASFVKNFSSYLQGDYRVYTMLELRY
jgi:hypothetical protein